MRAEYKATVKATRPTALDGFVGSAHVVTLSIYGPAPVGGEYVSVDLPLFTVEHARALGPLYGVQDAVRVTVEAGESKADRLEDEARRLRDTVASLERRANGDAAEIERLRISVQKLTTDYKAERETRAADLPALPDPSKWHILRASAVDIADILIGSGIEASADAGQKLLRAVNYFEGDNYLSESLPAWCRVPGRGTPTGEETERAIRESVGRLRMAIAADNSPLPDHDSGPVAGARSDDSNGQEEET